MFSKIFALSLVFAGFVLHVAAIPAIAAPASTHWTCKIIANPKKLPTTFLTQFSLDISDVPNGKSKALVKNFNSRNGKKFDDQELRLKSESGSATLGFTGSYFFSVGNSDGAAHDFQYADIILIPGDIEMNRKPKAAAVVADTEDCIGTIMSTQRYTCETK